MRINPRNELSPLPAFGCDPEILVRNPNGQLVEATEIVPAEGIKRTWNEFHYPGIANPVPNNHWRQKTKLIPVLFPDGVQLEFNTNAFDCIAYTVNSIAHSMTLLKKDILPQTGHTLDFKTKAEFLTNEQWEKLTPRGKQLGSLPSMNAYGHPPLMIDEKNEKLRTGAGHIHIGFEGNTKWNEKLDLLAKIHDRIVAIPSILLDIDSGNVLRRTMYGRAGEYRIQPHGFEYRTLSNFWLTSGPLAGFVFGASRLAMAIYNRELKGEDMMGMINIPDDVVQEVINNNDVPKALELFQNNIVPFINGHVTATDGLWPGMLDQFLFMHKVVVEKGLEFFWPDPLDHWTNLPEAHDFGWTWMMEVKVPQIMQGMRTIA